MMDGFQKNGPDRHILEKRNEIYGLDTFRGIRNESMIAQ